MSLWDSLPFWSIGDWLFIGFLGVMVVIIASGEDGPGWKNTVGTIFGSFFWVAVFVFIWWVLFPGIF